MTEIESEDWHRRVKWALKSVVILVGFLHVWANRHTIGVDGVSYLDMGHSYFRGDWNMAINAYWSPLYPGLLGLVIWLINPPPHVQYTILNLANFAIYAVALLCFDFFLAKLIRFHEIEVGGTSHLRLPRWTWIAFGYTLFTWSSLFLIELDATTPDLCVAAFVYLAAGMLLRLLIEPPTWSAFALFGLILGCGYLAKAAMFPMAFVFLGVSWLAVGNFRKTSFALVVFAIVGGPWIAALSSSKGRLTIGDSGRLNYSWSVDDSAISSEPERGTLRRAHQVLQNPVVYEFGNSRGETYPVWYDPSR